MKHGFNVHYLLKNSFKLCLINVSFLLLACHFDKNSQAPTYAADPHCANIVQQMHATDAINQPSKRITMTQQAQLLKEYQTYHCDDTSNPFD